MKFDKQSLIVGLAIGVIVGGGLIGYLDANRPKPLFSSASVGAPDCEWWNRQLDFIYQQYRSGGNATQADWQRWANMAPSECDLTQSNLRIQ